MKRTIRFLSVFLAALLAFSVCLAAAGAEEAPAYTPIGAEDLLHTEGEAITTPKVSR